MNHNHDLGSATTTELAERLRDRQLVLIPVGATEQHGPNLGLATDYRVAEAIARRVADRLDGKALVTPPLPYGLSGHHMAFPGTVSISADAFQAVLLDVIQSLATHGVRHFLFVNGHMGNQNVLGVLTNRIHFELGYHVASAFYIAQARDAISRHAKTERWGHACEIETSVALAIAPDLVRTEALEPGDLIEDYGAFEDNYQPHALQVPKSFAERTRNGAFGDATLATREAGEDIVATATDRIVAFALDFLAKPWPEES